MHTHTQKTHHQQQKWLCRLRYLITSKTKLHDLQKKGATLPTSGVSFNKKRQIFQVTKLLGYFFLMEK